MRIQRKFLPDVSKPYLAAELTETYTQSVARLMDILERIASLDAQVAYVNEHAPPGVRARLWGVERTARNPEGTGLVKSS